jgi:hypothetical protein
MAAAERSKTMKNVLIAAGIALGLYLTGRAIAEPFVIHWADPASYRGAWGGPSLIGVLAVHCLPGLILPTVIACQLRHRVRGSAATRSLTSA